ncbi:MAG: tetratricopeptide repeat protein [Desulfobaccales bacterium]
MKKFIFILVVIAALLSASQAWTAEAGTAQDYLVKGNEQLKGGNLDQAVADYNKALELNPKLAWAYNNLGIIYLQKEDYDHAFAAYNKALEIDPKQAQFYNNRGGAYREIGHNDEAISDFNGALELNPSYANAYYNRAAAFYAKKDFDKAWADVNKAQSLGAKIDPKFLEGLRRASGREK